MAGHSKWANIKRRKGANDAKKSVRFAKLVKEITMAAKQGGPIPENNPRLRLAIQNAKSINLPKDNIDRAIKKGKSQDASDYAEVTYEGYAPHGVAVIVECMTDNPNRTVAAVRAIFAKHGGNLGKSGALAFLFNRKGIFTLKKAIVMQHEDVLTMAMIDAGAENIEPGVDFFYITCPLEAFGQVQHRLESLAITIEDSILQYIPSTSIALDKPEKAEVIKLIDTLEDHEDIQNVSHNLVLDDAP